MLKKIVEKIIGFFKGKSLTKVPINTDIKKVTNKGGTIINTGNFQSPHGSVTNEDVTISSKNEEGEE